MVVGHDGHHRRPYDIEDGQVMGLIEFVETGAFRLAQSSQHGSRIGDCPRDHVAPLLGLPKRRKNAKIRAGSEIIRRISAMLIFSIRTVVLAVAVSASSLSSSATLSVQSELLCSPEGLMRLIPQFNVNGQFTIPNPNADL